jgi:hypothetical protein
MGNFMDYHGIYIIIYIYIIVCFFLGELGNHAFSFIFNIYVSLPQVNDIRGPKCYQSFFKVIDMENSSQNCSYEC